MSTREEGLRVRRATRFDSLAILHCLRAAFEPYRDRYTAEAFADTTLTPHLLEDRLSEMAVFVAEASNGEIIGTVALTVLHAGEGHIRGMAVLPGWQGRGIAEALLARVESELREHKCSRLSLDTTAPLERAIRFYEKYGFHPSGVVSDFFGMPLYEYVKSL